MPAMISLEHVSKRWGAVEAIRAVSLDVAEGEFLALLGASGCGKTTTLKLVNRLVEPTAGRVLVDGEDVAGTDPVELRRRIGYVFQGIGLFPHMTVAQNVAVVPRLLRWDAAKTDRRVDELLEMVGLDPAAFRARMPRELSGGQQQRVGVARALAARPRVLLMDEPFGALDPITRQDVQEHFRNLHGKLGLTVMLVTHDVTEALLLADRIAIMQAGEIIGHGAPSRLLREPGHDDVAALMRAPRRQADRIEALARRDTSGKASDGS